MTHEDLQYQEYLIWKKHQEHEEYQYLDTISDIIKNGVDRTDRTGTGTLSKFGVMMKYSLKHNTIPLYTTRKVFIRGAIEELLWMLRGDTNANHLKEKNINIWNGNTTRSFLDNRGLNQLDEGDIGALYGFQMRHWGADYNGFEADYTGQGIDQIAKVIDLIKNTPDSRRIVVSNYNVSQLELGCLEPCHTLFQFYVNTETKELNSLLYMRSVDLCAGSVLNVVFYSIMTHLFAKITGYKAGEFTFMSGDTHVYKNHIESAKIQIEREPYTFPKINIKKDIKTLEDIESMSYEDFELVDYQHHPALKYEMSI